MSNPIQIDLDELKTFIVTLKTFNGNYAANWEQTKARWQYLLHTWNDPECAKFLDAVGWAQVQLEMERYLDQMKSYVSWLEQRATPLMAYREDYSGSGSSVSAPTSPTPPVTPQPRPIEGVERYGGSPENKLG